MPPVSGGASGRTVRCERAVVAIGRWCRTNGSWAGRHRPIERRRAIGYPMRDTRPSRYTLVVDPVACDGHGVCSELFPSA